MADFDFKKWPQAVFSEAEISSLSTLDLNDAPSLFDSETQWIGRLGENVFEMCLFHARIPFKRANFKDRFAQYDFRVGPWKLDVKMAGSNKEPKESYACGVVEEHLHGRDANGYVFGRFIKPSRTAYLFGWMTKKEFLDKAVIRKAGVKVTEHFTPLVDNREVKISDLRMIYEMRLGWK